MHPLPSANFSFATYHHRKPARLRPHHSNLNIGMHASSASGHLAPAFSPRIFPPVWPYVLVRGICPRRTRSLSSFSTYTPSFQFPSKLRVTSSSHPATFPSQASAPCLLLSAVGSTTHITSHKLQQFRRFVIFTSKRLVNTHILQHLVVSTSSLYTSCRHVLRRQSGFPSALCYYFGPHLCSTHISFPSPFKLVRFARSLDSGRPLGQDTEIAAVRVESQDGNVSCPQLL